MKTYTTKIAKNGATLYYSVETGKRIAKETALENERNYIIANGTAAERYELAKEEHRINEHGKIEKLGYHRVIRTCRNGYYYDEKYEWHTVNDSSADTDLQKDYALTLEQFRAEVEAENAIEIKREKIISTPLVTAEAMEVAVDAEIANATAEADPAVKAEFEAIEKATELASNFSHEVQELFTAKADVDTLSTAQAAYEQAQAEVGNEITTCHRAVDDMTKDTTDYYTEREILIDGLLEAEDKALAAKKAIYKQTLLTALIEKFSKNETDETKEEEPEMTVKQPTEKELIEAEMRSVAEERDKFIDALEEAEANPEIAQSHIDYLKSEIDKLGDRYQELWAQLDAINTAEVIAEDDGSNEDADETIQECIADIAKITGKEIVDDKSYPDDETPETELAAAEPVDEFTAELERLKAEREAAGKALAEKISARRAAEEALRKAEEEERAAEDKSHEANCAVRKFFTRKGKELTDKIWEFTPTAEELYKMFAKTIVNANAMNVTLQDGSKILGTHFEGAYVTPEYYFEHWFIEDNLGFLFARYDTPAQVEQVIAMLKAAIERGDTEFTFPTIEQLNQPINSTDAEISDSLARAMQTAEYNVQTYRRHNNPDGIRYEMELYSICADALNELKRRVA